MHSQIPLQLVTSPNRAIVEALVGETAEVRRLQELGIFQGVVLEVIRAGSPCIARLGERDLCLRLGGSLHILVSIPEAA